MSKGSILDGIGRVLENISLYSSESFNAILQLFITFDMDRIQ
jgi:hypothetical protein